MSAVIDLFLVGIFLAPIVYLVYAHYINPLLYAYSAIDPYIYYSYSPGFWSVDISFWLFTPLMIYGFRRQNISWIYSILYAFSLDAVAVGAFLTYFSLIYHINIFTSHYYSMTFYYIYLIFIPIRHLRLNTKLSLIILAVIIDVGLMWEFLEPGNIGYFVSPSVVFDLVSIFLFFFLVASLTFPEKWRRTAFPCDCCHVINDRKDMFFAVSSFGKICGYCLHNCSREDGMWIHKDLFEKGGLNNV